MVFPFFSPSISSGNLDEPVEDVRVEQTIRPRSKRRVVYAASLVRGTSPASDLLGLAPASDNNCDNYTVRPIITCRHDATFTEQPRNNKRPPPSHFHEMSHQIVAGCNRSREECTGLSRYARPRRDTSRTTRSCARGDKRAGCLDLCSLQFDRLVHQS